MADLIQGNDPNLSSTAPLSQAQTVQMCQHLQAEIRGLESSLGEVKRDLMHTREHLEHLRERSTQTYDEVHSLQVGFMDTNVNLDKVSKELGRVGQATQQLQANDQNAKDRLTLLDEGKKMQDTQIDLILKDVQFIKSSDRKLQDSIERQVNEDLRNLRKEMSTTNLTVNQMFSEQKQTAAFSRENRDALRDVRVDVEKVLNEVKKANTVTNILENRLASTAKGLQQSWAKCSELSDTMVKLTECYDKTRARVADAEGLMKELGTAGKRTHSELEEAVRQLENNSDRLSTAAKQLDEQESATEDTRHEIHALKQGQATTLKNFNALKGEVNEVKYMAAAMKGAIKEQSNMLLPNIHLDSQEAVGASKRHGTMLVSSNNPRPSGRNTARDRAGNTSSSWT